MDILSALAIAFFGFLLGLIATWINARVNKSTDTKTQLLIKIDDWIYELIQHCAFSMFTYSKVVKIDWAEQLKEQCKLITGRAVGYANALKNTELNTRIIELNEKLDSYVKSSLDILDTGGEDKEIHPSKEQFSKLYNNITDIRNASIEIHRIIAGELMRIF
jgi:hypothetical protein